MKRAEATMFRRFMNEEGSGFPKMPRPWEVKINQFGTALVLMKCFEHLQGSSG